MPTTENGYYYPDASTNLTPLAAILAAMAASSDAAYKKIPAVFDTIAARDAAITTPTEGRIVYTKDYDILWHYAGGWRPVGVPTFATVEARSLAMPTPTAGMRCFVGSGATMDEYIHNGTAWKLWSRPTTNWTPVITGITAGMVNGGCTYRVVGGDITYTVVLNTTGPITGYGLHVSGMPLAYESMAFQTLGTTTLIPTPTKYQGFAMAADSGTGVLIYGPDPINGSVTNNIFPAIPATWGARAPAVVVEFTAKLA